MLLLSEWSLSISRPTALPHLLAVLLQSIDPQPEGNVRTVLSPTSYIDAAAQAGWELVGSRTFTPTEGLEDGIWETRAALSMMENRLSRTEATEGEGERDAASVRLESLRAHAHALQSSLASEGGLDRVESMNVWTAVLRPRPAVDQ